MPPDCDGDGTPDATDGDDDNDLLSDTLETAIKTVPCNADSDGDGMSDGFEYQSAIDLNNGVGSLPYPGKRPYPNPLNADGGTDYDGDGLTASQEHALWRYVGPNALPLSYSAGLKRTAGPVDDDLRDGDADGLGNWVEFNGPMVPGLVEQGVPVGEALRPGRTRARAPSTPTATATACPTAPTTRTSTAGRTRTRSMRGPYRIQPFNPCLPDYNSRTCSTYIPFGQPYPPFDGPLPPSPIAWP